MCHHHHHHHHRDERGITLRRAGTGSSFPLKTFPSCLRWRCPSGRRGRRRTTPKSRPKKSFASHSILPITYYAMQRTLTTGEGSLYGWFPVFLGFKRPPLEPPPLEPPPPRFLSPLFPTPMRIPDQMYCLHQAMLSKGIDQ